MRTLKQYIDKLFLKFFAIIKDMDNQQFSQEKKIRIEKILVEKILAGYKNKLISYEEMKESASYILDNFNSIQNQEQLIGFLENLVSYWPIFKPILSREKIAVNENRDKELIENLTNQIKNSANN